MPCTQKTRRPRLNAPEQFSGTGTMARWHCGTVARLTHGGSLRLRRIWWANKSPEEAIADVQRCRANFPVHARSLLIYSVRVHDTVMRISSPIASCSGQRGHAIAPPCYHCTVATTTRVDVCFCSQSSLNSSLNLSVHPTDRLLIVTACNISTVNISHCQLSQLASPIDGQTKVSMMSGKSKLQLLIVLSLLMLSRHSFLLLVSHTSFYILVLHPVVRFPFFWCLPQ